MFNAVEILKKGSFDSIIAFGGGSPIDSAKAISALATYGGNISDYKFFIYRIKLHITTAFFGTFIIFVC